MKCSHYCLAIMAFGCGCPEQAPLAERGIAAECAPLSLALIEPGVNDVLTFAGARDIAAAGWTWCAVSANGDLECQEPQSPVNPARFFRTTGGAVRSVSMSGRTVCATHADGCARCWQLDERRHGVELLRVSAGFVQATPDLAFCFANASNVICQCEVEEGCPAFSGDHGRVVALESAGERVCVLWDRGHLECAGGDDIWGPPLVAAGVDRLWSGPAAICVREESRTSCWGRAFWEAGDEIRLDPVHVPQLDGLSELWVGDGRVCALRERRLACFEYLSEERTWREVSTPVVPLPDGPVVGASGSENTIVTLPRFAMCMGGCGYGVRVP